MKLSASVKTVAVATALIAAAAALPARAQDFTMKLAIVAINDPLHEYIKEYKNKIEAKTQGKIKAELYPAAQLFPAASRIISAAGFNVMLETEAWRAKHDVVPFARKFDDQYRRAARRRT